MVDWFNPWFALLFVPLYNAIFIVLVESFRRTKVTQWIFFVLLPVIYTPLWRICDTLNPPGMIKAWSVVIGCWIMYALRYRYEWLIENHPKTYNMLLWFAGLTVMINIFEAVLYELFEIYFYEDTYNLLFPGNPLTGVILILTISHPKTTYVENFIETNKWNKNNNFNKSYFNRIRVVPNLDRKAQLLFDNCPFNCKSKIRQLLLGNKFNGKYSKNKNEEMTLAIATNTVNDNNSNNNNNNDAGSNDTASQTKKVDTGVADSGNGNANTMSNEKEISEMRMPIINYDFGILWVLLYTMWNMIFGYNVQCIEPIPGFTLHLGVPLYFVLFYCNNGEWIEIRAFSLWLWLFVDGFCFNIDETIPFFELIECDQVGLKLWIMQLLSIISFVFALVVLIDQIYSQYKYIKSTQNGQSNNQQQETSNEMRYHSLAQHLVNKFYAK